MSLILFAVITIFIGVTLSEAGAPEYVIYILAAYVAYQLFIELVMEFHECCVVRANTGGLHYNYNNLIHVYFSLKDPCTHCVCFAHLASLIWPLFILHQLSMYLFVLLSSVL